MKPIIKTYTECGFRYVNPRWVCSTWVTSDGIIVKGCKLVFSKAYKVCHNVNEFAGYNVTVVEQLTLYLFGKPVMYDALMGSYVYTTKTQVAVSPRQISITPMCIPTERLLGGAAVSRLEGNNTLVTYFNETIQVTGCGQDYTYYKPVKVATSMVNGADYIRDPNTGQLCSYPYTTQNSNGWLTCNNGQNAGSGQNTGRRQNIQ